MYTVIIAALTAIVASSSAFAADYKIPTDGTLADAIKSANANPDKDTYQIEISGSSADNGTIRKSTSIIGDATAELSGALTFAGTGVNSLLKDLTFLAGGTQAVSNGTMGIGDAQNLIIDNVTFEQRKLYGFGGSILNIGNMTVQNKSLFANNKADYGGAIHHGSNTLDIKDSKFSENTATSSGGAVNNTGTLFVTGSTFEKNYSVYYGGAIQTSGNTDIQGTTFTDNHASEGGAIRMTGKNGSLNISDSSFINNYTPFNSQGASEHGGAINSAGRLNIIRTRFQNNRSTEGGAIKINDSSSEVMISGSNFSNNYAAIRNGGAISQSNGTLTVSDTVFFQNHTDNTEGGGGAIHTSANAQLTVSQTSFSQNYADKGNGGALQLEGETILNNVTAAGNHALMGGAVSNTGSLTITGGSSFNDNKAEIGGAIYTQNKLLLDTADGDITFSGNRALDASRGGADIYMAQNVIIQGSDNTLSMDGGFAGTGLISKTGGNTLIFRENADNTLFKGDFFQSAGTTLVYADNFFGGTNSVSDGSILHFERSARINNLNLKNGGRLDLRRTGVFIPTTLTVADLISDGSAVVALQTDGTVSDLLKITGTATGNVTLDIDALSTNPTKQAIEVVNAAEAGGNADFKLAGEKLDIGAHEYNLVRETDANWYLKTEGNLNPTAQAINGLPALHLSIVNAGLNELRKRMGDLRSSNPNTPAGTWIRGYGKHLRIHEKTGAKINLVGMEGGFDVMAEMLGGRTYFGAMGGYLSSDDLRVLQANSSDAKGHTKTPVAGLYATWLHDDTKWFADFTARHYRVHTDLDNILSNNKTNGYDVKRNFWAFSAETGRLFDTPAPDFINTGKSRISIEPKVELRYVRGAAKNFTTRNGNKGHINTTNSLVTRLNLQTSYLPNGKKSNWKPFIELGLYNEWLGKTKVKYADVDLTTSNLGGLGFETSLGFNAMLSEDSYWYGAMTFEAGKAYTSYQLNTGLRVTF